MGLLRARETWRVVREKHPRSLLRDLFFVRRRRRGSRRRADCGCRCGDRCRFRSRRPRAGRRLRRQAMTRTRQRFWPREPTADATESNVRAEDVKIDDVRVRAARVEQVSYGDGLCSAQRQRFHPSVCSIRSRLQAAV
eukprot:972114-Pleurochrysis_carterae.AAC.3